MAISPAAGTTAVTSANNRTPREGDTWARTTKLTTKLYVTYKGFNARETVLTVSREPKTDSSTMKKIAEPVGGRGRKRTEEETTKKVKSRKNTTDTRITGEDGDNKVEGFRKGRTNFLTRCQAESMG
mmetsp:Transcript_11907/g.21475  ORF Transcript_11907/g.21475 Transcript_11907/m.21475 type:complete len:127 (-) Transcript_11907:143-523(-)